VIEKAYQKWGMNPQSKITVLKAFTKDGQAELWHILQAIDYAITLKLNIISASFNYRDNNPRPDSLITTKLVLEHVIDRAKEYNLLFIASAGNDSIHVDKVKGAFPATFLSENLLVVAACENAAANQAKYSNYGNISVDVAANGTFITRDSSDKVEYIARGTSFATPMVAATTAFLAAQEGAFEWARAKQLLINQLDKNNLNWVGKLNPSGGVLKPVCWNDAVWNTATFTSITHLGQAGEPIDITIVNMSGQVVLSEKTVLNADGQWIWDWNMLNIANGIYIVQCRIGNEMVLTKKIVKMN
jgi:subtilisin family serine protease